MNDDQWVRTRERIEARMHRRRHRSAASGVILGGIVVAVGLILLLDNMGILRAGDYWRFWPLLLVGFGLSRLAEGCGLPGKVFGGAIAVFGVLILLADFDIILLDFNLVWPLAVIGFGLSMLWKAVNRRRSMDGTGGTSDPEVSLVGVFSGGRRRIDSKEFRGCDVVAVFGGFEIDLRNATIAEGKAVVDVNAMFGGVEIFVPESWSVLMRGMGIFGGFVDKTIPPKVVEGAPGPQLVVTGYAIFGGASVRN